MRSPSAALAWEIWRKNRWGFVLLLVLLVICAALSRVVVHYQREVDRLIAEHPKVAAGSLTSPQLIRAPDGSVAPRVIQFKLGTNLVYEGLLSPVDVITWSTPVSNPDSLRLMLGARKLFEGPLPPDEQLRWSFKDGSTGSVELNTDPGFAELVSEATMMAQNWREWALAWSGMLMGFSFLVVCTIFSGAEPHSARGFTGIPQRRFTLPVRTSELVGWPIVLGCLTIVLGYFAWSRLVMPPLLPMQEKLPDRYFIGLLCTGLVGFQALVWGLPSFPRTRICVIVLFVFGGLPALGWLWSKLPSAIAFVWLASVAAAWFGVERERRGGWASWQGPVAVARFVEKLRPPPLGFCSVLHAQFWIEWRRNGRLALGLLILFLTSAVGWCLLGKLGFPLLDKSSGVVIPLAIMALPVWLAITGLNFARDSSSKRLVLSSFTATRPVSTGTLLTAKLLASAAIWVLAVIAFAVGYLCFIAIESELRRERPNLMEIIVPLVLSAHIFVGILPLCLSGRLPGFPWSLLPLLLIYGLAANAFSWFGRHQSYMLLFVLLVMLVLIKLMIAYWGFRRALGLRLLSVWFVVSYVSLWLVATIVLTGVACWHLTIHTDWGIDSIFLLPLAFLATPLARIALSPLALAMNRHR